MKVLIDNRTTGVICQEVGTTITIVNDLDGKPVDVPAEELLKILNEEYTSKKYSRSVRDDMDDIKSMFCEELNLSLEKICDRYCIWRCGNANGEVTWSKGCIPYIHFKVSNDYKHPDRHDENYTGHLVIEFRRYVRYPDSDTNPDYRIGIWDRKMNAEEFHELQRNKLSMWQLIDEAVENYKKYNEEQKQAENREERGLLRKQR